MRLLGAYHDGFIELTYRDVTRYTLELVQRSAAGHGDWRYDELRLATNGRLLHEIEWAQAFDTARRVIESADVEYAWLPIGGS